MKNILLHDYFNGDDRKSGCEKGVLIKAVHADECSDGVVEKNRDRSDQLEDGVGSQQQQEAEEENIEEGDEEVVDVQKESSQKTDFGTKRRKGFRGAIGDEAAEDDDLEPAAAAGDDDNLESRIGSQSCTPSHYDSMKEQLLLKSKSFAIMIRRADFPS